MKDSGGDLVMIFFFFFSALSFKTISMGLVFR